MQLGQQDVLNELEQVLELAVFGRGPAKPGLIQLCQLGGRNRKITFPGLAKDPEDEG